MTATTTPTPVAAAARPPRRSPLITIGAAALAAAAVWAVAEVVSDGLTVTMDGRAPMMIGLPLVVAAALAAGLGGWGVLALLLRLTRRARLVWTVLAIAVVLASFAPVLSAQATVGTRIALGLMHVVVAAVLVPGLRRIPSGLTAGPGAAPRSDLGTS